MNTSTKNFTLCIFAGLLAIACGNSNSKRSEKEIEELNAQAKIPESVKPIEKISFDFEKYTNDQLPGEWSEFYTGSGSTKWQVKDDDGNKVMV